jgi:hypothetical protein
MPGRRLARGRGMPDSARRHAFAAHDRGERCGERRGKSGDESGGGRLHLLHVDIGLHCL